MKTGSATNVMVLVSAVSQLEKSNNAIFVISSDSEKSHATEPILLAILAAQVTCFAS